MPAFDIIHCDDSMNSILENGHYYTSLQTLGGVVGKAAFSRMLGICLSDANSTSYHWQASSRYDAPHVVFQLTLSGRGTFRRGRKTWSMTPGRAFLCESSDSSVSYYYPRDAKEPWRFFFVTFTGDPAVEMVRELVRQSKGVFDFPIDHPLIEKYVSYLQEEWDSVVIPPSESWRLVMELLYALLRTLDCQQAKESEHALIRRAHDLMFHFSDCPLNASELALKLRVSREYLTRIFTKETGESPYRFIMRMRLLQACNLLKNTDLPIKEIARRMRFASVSAFCRPFKRLVHLSPSEFRERGVMSMVEQENADGARS